MDLDEAIRTCEIAIVLVDHDQFKMIPLAERRHLAVIDTRGVRHEEETEAGAAYKDLGEAYFDQIS